MKPDRSHLKDFLEERYLFYNQPQFIDGDPISIPHQFILKEDIELSGFLTAIVSWGQRKTIIKNSLEMMRLMENSPYEFILNANDKDLKPFISFRHRTFSGLDCIYFLKALQNLYLNHGGLEKALTSGDGDTKDKITHFRKLFLELPFPKGLTRHISNPADGSAAKRLNMFLRWMVRKDGRGVDFGIWDGINSNQLMCPLDVHSGRVARKLGLLERKPDDWKAVEELTGNLRMLDSADPVKYDFALFGLGIFERF